MSSFNEITLLGNIGGDVTLRHNQNSQTASFSMAINERYSANRVEKRRIGAEKIAQAATIVKCGYYESWETGLSFYILKEKVDRKIFGILRNCGLYHHNYDDENEERFAGWCFSGHDWEKTQMQLAEHGIRMYK